MTWKRRTPAANRRRRRRREQVERSYQALADEANLFLTQLQEMFGDDPEALEQATQALQARR